MSRVTNVIVLPGTQETDSTRSMVEKEEELRTALLSPSPEADGWAWGQALHEISHANWPHTPPDDMHERRGGGELWGGSKVPECDVYAAAFNHLDWEAFRRWIESIPWARRSQVRVLRMEEDDTSFSVWTFIDDGELVCALPSERW